VSSDEPRQIARLPHDKHGRPVPWFVAFIDGEPDFRVIRQGGIGQAFHKRLCWVCGQRFARRDLRVFMIGPMCAINRVAPEPPSHAECAIYSVKSCPFLTRPDMHRRDRHIPEGTVRPAGHMIERNPGVTLLWYVTETRFRAFLAAGEMGAPPGMLFELGPPAWVEWYAEGRRAMRHEVIASIDSGLPALRDVAAAQGPAAERALAEQHFAALQLVPS
jgi:hypothetical protein